MANGYGGRDAGFIAHECPQGGMHITAEDIIVEIDRRRRPARCTPGESGEIVVTHLATRDFPFIRYRTGDFGVLDTAACACGRGLPLLREIQGRTTDFVVAARRHGHARLALIYVMRDLPGIAAFKIIQETADAHARADRSRRGLWRRRQGKPSCRACAPGLARRWKSPWKKSAAIAPEASGKYRYVVSKVAT